MILLRHSFVAASVPSTAKSELSREQLPEQMEKAYDTIVNCVLRCSEFKAGSGTVGR